MMVRLKRLELVDGDLCLDGVPVDFKIVGQKILSQRNVGRRRMEGADSYWQGDESVNFGRCSAPAFGGLAGSSGEDRYVITYLKIVRDKN